MSKVKLYAGAEPLDELELVLDAVDELVPDEEVEPVLDEAEPPVPDEEVEPVLDEAEPVDDAVVVAPPWPPVPGL